MRRKNNVPNLRRKFFRIQSNPNVLTFKIKTFIFHTTGTIDQVDQMWILEGGTATLHCNISTKDPNEHVATVLWYRGSQGEPIFT